MRRPLPLRRLTAVLLVAGLWVIGLLLAPAGPALAEWSRPTVDPSAPTPTTPHPDGPPQGSAPDGSTVGGERLDTRGLVTVAGAPPLPEGIDARGWLVADAGTGAVLGARDPHGRYYPASTLKALTLLTLVPVLDPALVVESTVEDEAIEGSRVGLVRGGQYPVDLLFRALVMQSGNDVANALARAAGGVGTTLAAMNETAAHLGAHDTVAGTPSGLDVAGQSSSPYDLALILRQLVTDPYSLDLLQTRTAQMPTVGTYEGYQIQNQNTLLSSYPGTLAGKTGFTDAARHTFVVAAERDGRRLVVSVMQAERRPVHELEQARRLLDWGFAVPADAEPVGRLVEPGEVAAAMEAAEAAEQMAAEKTAAMATSGGTAAATPDTRAGTGSVAAPGSATGTAPLVPAGLAAGALVIVAATVIGRRRAVRRIAPPEPAPDLHDGR
ncbi:serine hydrolase [Modestobacter sp. VKM Ac-2979]|uniref:D-alanyl-D-alanine carboxypeptidase family protein n=1 Tax=unclassified Modestobacter TaxID=2643866 RepID=UPI0022AB5E5B|nr:MULTISPECIES: serine hydrolase [unclassified Modestobacter]MCZ2812271.1 serine hydrolase [Modestobacter sp. VKM Ac-2979]MCZ2841161.1 serine hydrolase [Modestobacter sp. VKM Ac-2980]